MACHISSDKTRNYSTGSINQQVNSSIITHKNLNNNGKIISQTKSDGLSNLKVPKVDQYVQTPTLELFKEYLYSTDDLSPFNQFRIKIVGTSKNAAVVPQLRNLRATALA